MTSFLYYEFLPLPTFYLPYEHYLIRTSAEEYLLTKIFPYEPCAYELLFGLLEVTEGP